MTTEQEILLNQRHIRREVLIRKVLHQLRDTIQLWGKTPEIDTNDTYVTFTDTGVQVLQPLIEAVEILESIIYASDGCNGHRHCTHSMEPWQRARALLQGKWEAETDGTEWPKPKEVKKI